MRQFAPCQQVELSSALHLPKLLETASHALGLGALWTDLQRFRGISTPFIYHFLHLLYAELDTVGHFKVKENNERMH